MDLGPPQFASADRSAPVFKKQPTPFQRIAAIQFLRRLGPGLITGASDDDPSGIGTYSQVGAQLGYSIGWTMLLTYPLMVAIQEISARIGRTTGHGNPDCAMLAPGLGHARK